MKKTSARILAGIMAAASVASFAACGGDSGEPSVTTEATTTTAKTEWTGDNIEVTVAEDTKSDVDISGQTLIWLSNYDLNPTNDNPERSAEIAIFNDTYGAQIEWRNTDYVARFDTLATQILSGDGPDIFVFDDSLFPKDMEKMFQPIDDIIDFSDPLWSDMKGTADNFVLNGKHYVAPIGYRSTDYVILMYNRTYVDSLGIDDPYELYEKNEWTWDNFIRVMSEFVANDPENTYGIGGFWTPAFVGTAGEPIVDYKNGKFTNNLASPAIEGAQNVLLRLKNEEMINPAGWIGPEEAFTDNQNMFYGMGTWALTGAKSSAPEGEEVVIVPFPRNPDKNEYYMSKAIYAHMWVKGSEKADAVKIWLDTLRLVNTDKSYLDVAKQKTMTNNPIWTDADYDRIESFNDDSKFPLMWEYGYGISGDMAGDDGYIRQLYNGVANGTYESWSQAREEFTNIIDSNIAEWN